jgi:hypothetical protein
MRQLLFILTLTTGVLTPVFGQYLEEVIDIGSAQSSVLCNPLSNKIYTNIGNAVTIIDGATRHIITTVPLSNEVRYLCLNSVSNKVYCLPGGGSRLAIIDGVTDSLRRLTIPHGGPSAFAYNATSNRLYVGCGNEGTVVVVDGAADTILSELHLESRWVTTMFWNPATNHLFCSTFQDTMYVIDCQTNQTRARWFVDPFDEWCYSPVTGRVYTGNSNTVWAFSPRGDSLLAAISQGSVYLCAVPFPDKVYIAAGWVYVLDGSTNVIADTIRYGGGAMVCDTSKGKVYALGGVWVLDARADTLLTTIPLPARLPSEICRNPLDGRVYVTDYMGDSVYVLRDTMPGIEETPSAEVRTPNRGATVVRGVLLLGAVGGTQNTGHRAELLDISGRKVMELRPGANDVSDLAPGVYFVITSSPSSSPPEGERVGVRGREASSVRKVVIAR